MLVLFWSFCNYAQSSNQNYIKTTSYKVPILVNNDNSTSQVANVVVSYFDGLGRPSQIINVNSTELSKSFIKHIEYDAYGREATSFLPYPGLNGSDEFDENALQNTLEYPQYYNQSPMSVSKFENFPGGKIVQQSAPGISWSEAENHLIRTDYLLNTPEDNVYDFNNIRTYNTANRIYTNALSVSRIISPNRLKKTVVKNENWTSGLANTTEQYEDFFGQTLLKRTYNNNTKHDTYYVFDSVGNLIYVIPPLAVDNGISSTSQTVPYLYTKNIDYEQVFVREDGSPITSGGGGIVVKIINGFLKIEISAGFAGSAVFNTNASFPLDAIHPIPDIVVGNLALFYNSNLQYKVVIENNSLKFLDLTPSTPPTPFTSSSFNPGFVQIQLPSDFLTTTQVVTSFNLNQVQELIYQYRYDQRNRIVEKKLPGKLWEFICYDKLDRVVATGPVISPDNPNETGVLYTKYDAFNRTILTGYARLNNQTRTQIQAFYDSATVLNESKSATTNTINDVQVAYTNNLEHNPDMKVFTVNYYDDYNFPRALLDFSSTLVTNITYNNTSLKPKGLATGTWVRVLNNATRPEGETTTFFYDDKARLVKTHKENYLGGQTISESLLDFTGKVLKKLTLHRRDNQSGIETRIDEQFEYSPQDRLLTHLHRVNGGNWEVLSNNTYDELGQLISKKVGKQDPTGASFLQKVDYTYNIRGWLTNINNVADTADEVTDLFAFKINYNTREQSIPGVENLYNGNISETYWRTESDGFTRMYGYQYDDLNRLLKGNYRKLGYSVTGNYDETLSYDKHGNITSLQRNGFADADFGTSVEIDNLVYAYDGNQLRNVVDMSNSLNGFRDNVNNGDGDYTYDVYGNMTRDNNKRIANIDYNHLNLPTVINFQNNGGRIRYTYDALGVKVRKEVDDVNGTTTTDYLDGFQYKNGELQFFPTPEGYVQFISNKFFYVYNYTDHLGNVRMSYTDNGTEAKILEENHYYPFGLKHENYASERFERVKETNGELFVIQPTERREWQYKFQGQERQDELNLNWDSFKWRNYDYAIGRFMSIDLLAEKYSYQSPYNFCENRVLEARELEGLEAFFIHGTESSPNRWTEKSVKTIMQLTNNKTSNTGFSWENRSGITNNSHDRYEAAKSLVDYIMANRVKGEGITLIGHSHGGNVAIQAAKMFYEKTGERIDIIAIATPAYNTPKDSKPFMEDPNTQLGHKAIDNFLSLFNTIDGVQGGLAGSNYFNELGGDGTYTRNAGIIDVSNFYSWYEFLDAHSFDVEHPSTIQDAIDKGNIKRPEYPGSAGSADDPKNRKKTKE